MEKINLTTPENIDVEYKLAGLASRTAAVIIDSLLQALVLFVIVIFVLLVKDLQAGFWDNYYGWLIGLALFVVTGVIYSYYIVAELKMNGRTPGKKMLNLRTIRDNGQPLSVKHSVLRNLFRVFIDMSGLGALFILFSQEHKRIGDFAASTIVVIEEKEQQPVTIIGDVQLATELKQQLSQEEYWLLADYYQRKNYLKNSNNIKHKLKRYFNDNYQDQDVLAKISKLLN